VLTAPTPTNGVNFLTLPISGDQQWYRLQLP
jgi:hypothetical protein